MSDAHLKGYLGPILGFHVFASDAVPEGMMLTIPMQDYMGGKFVTRPTGQMVWSNIIGMPMREMETVWVPATKPVSFINPRTVLQAAKPSPDATRTTRR